MRQIVAIWTGKFYLSPFSVVISFLYIYQHKLLLTQHSRLRILFNNNNNNNNTNYNNCKLYSAY